MVGPRMNGVALDRNVACGLSTAWKKSVKGAPPFTPKANCANAEVDNSSHVSTSRMCLGRPKEPMGCKRACDFTRNSRARFRAPARHVSRNATIEQIDQPLLVDHFHAQFARLVQLRARLFAGDQETGFLAYCRADLSASRFYALPRLLATDPGQRAGQDKSEPR